MPPISTSSAAAASMRVKVSGRPLLSGKSRITATNSSPPSRASVSPSCKRPLHPLGHGRQQRVAACLAVAVVDGLEAVEIEICHAQQLTPPARLRHGLAQPVGQQRPVRKPRQRIVVRYQLQLVLLFLDLS